MSKPYGNKLWQENEHLLGTMTDKELGKLLGRSASGIATARHRRGIPAYGHGRRNHAQGVWVNPELEALLGTMADAELGEIAGVSRQAVYHARRSRDIPPFWMHPDDRPGGLWEQHEHLLGTMSDPDLGKLLGVTRDRVFCARKRRGVEPFWKNPWDDPNNVALLGTMPDAELGRRMGLSRHTISGARRRRGIVGYQVRRRKTVTRTLAMSDELQLDRLRRYLNGDESFWQALFLIALGDADLPDAVQVELDEAIIQGGERGKRAEEFMRRRAFP